MTESKKHRAFRRVPDAAMRRIIDTEGNWTGLVVPVQNEDLLISVWTLGTRPCERPLRDVVEGFVLQMLDVRAWSLLLVCGRAESVARRLGCESVRDVARLTREQLLAMKNCGVETVNRIELLLGGVGLRLGMTFDADGRPKEWSNSQDHLDLVSIMRGQTNGGKHGCEQTCNAGRVCDAEVRCGRGEESGGSDSHSRTGERALVGNGVGDAQTEGDIPVKEHSVEDAEGQRLPTEAEGRQGAVHAGKSYCPAGEEAGANPTGPDHMTERP